jgi:hypothetical protein
MIPDPTPRYFYHVGPWRRAMPWMIFGPFLLGPAALIIFASTPNDRGAGWLILALMAPITLGVHAMVSYARLELSAEGVRLRQIGMKLAASWSEIEGLRLEPGREGFVTHHAISGSGAGSLSATRGAGYYGNPIYNAEQRALMAQRRWIPIDPFSWHLQRGTLRQDLATLAPAVHPISSLLAPPGGSASANAAAVPVTSRRKWIAAICLIGGLLGVGIVLAMMPTKWSDRTFSLLYLVMAPLTALRMAWSTRNAFRSKARLVGVIFAFLTLFAVLWCFVALNSVVVAFNATR